MLDTFNQSEPLRQFANKDSMSTEEALNFFDALPTVEIDNLIGRWRGTELSTGHPLDEMLKTLGWYGKEFIDRDHVHPLLFSDNKGMLFLPDPKRLPVNLVLKVPIPRKDLVRQALLAAQPLLQTHQAKARIRMLE